MATQVAPLELQSGDTTLSRAMSSYTKLLRAAYLADTLEELENLRALAGTPSRVEHLQRLIDFYRGERRAIAEELGL